jgi:hypothetical protein
MSDKLFRPSIGLNTGLIGYFGDVGNLDGLSRQPHMNWGTQLTMLSPLTDAFQMKAFVFFGNITQEERIPSGNANFSTPIRMGGLQFSYNFDHFLPEKRTVEPYVGVGISTFEFNSKADLFDANGNEYNYWSDGTIRSESEFSVNKNDAIILERDYSYESDLRSTNENSGLPYALRGVTIPFSVGANLKVNDFFQINMGTDFHLSLTDNIDNISGAEHGRSGNDHFMFTSVGLVYNLHHNKQTKIEKTMDVQFDSIEFEDEDSDGIADIIDLCPFTGEDVAVDDRGCPLDSDGDGVPDFLDADLMTPAGTLVNLDGSPLEDEQILAMYQTYKDSVGNQSYLKSTKATEDYERATLKVGSRIKGYQVLIENSQNLSSDQIAQLLSISDIRSEQNGNNVEYYLGDFQSSQEAYNRMLQLNEMNLESKVVYNKLGKTEELSSTELEILAESAESFNSNPDEITFRVQIGAYKERLSENIFKDIDHVLVVTGTDGLTRYVSGSFKTIKEAAEHRIDLLLEGFEGSFVTAYKGGKRISLKEAGARVSKKENLEAAPQIGGINKSFVEYSIEVGSFTGRVPAEMLGKFFDLGNVKPIRESQGTTKYIYRTFSEKSSAIKELDKLKSGKFPNAKLIGLFNGTVISSEEADHLRSE